MSAEKASNSPEEPWVFSDDFTMVPHVAEPSKRWKLGLGPIIMLVFASLILVASLFAFFLGSGECPDTDVSCQMARAAALSIGLMGVFGAVLIAGLSLVWVSAARRREAREEKRLKEFLESQGD